MPKRRGVVAKIFYKHIKNTPPKAIVTVETIYICRLTSIVLKITGLADFKVYLNTKVLKHLYDKRPAEEFDSIICHLHEIVKYPEKIYKNKTSKSGDYCLVKKIDDFEYLISLQLSNEDGSIKISVVTAFRVRNEKYLKNYELLWSWKGGIPSS
ncbi:MAG: hypothetical protein V1865_02385 [bacterium]